MSEGITFEGNLLARWFENHYVCPKCDTSWTDEWSCTCNDRCPTCNGEIEPITSTDLSCLLTNEDFLAAARLIYGVANPASAAASPQEAREYAEAILEGGEHRFRPERHIPDETPAACVKS